MNISKMKLKDLLDMTYEDELSHLTKRQYLTLEKRLRKETERRLKVIEKHGLSSQAFIRYVGFEIPSVSSLADTRQSMQHKVAMYSNFLSAKSSTYRGLKQIYTEQEKRIFGNKHGFDNEEQRTRFWSAYTEFKNQNPALVQGIDTSNKVLQYLGQLSFWRSREFNASDLDEIVTRMLGIGGVDYRARTGRDIPEFDI